MLQGVKIRVARALLPSLLAILFPLLLSSQLGAATPANLRDENLVAWCIVPFDAKQRGPEERAKMVRSLGLRRVAYDWREKHVATFEEEILQYKKHRLEFFAFWGAHEQAFQLFEKYGLHPQIWQTLAAPPGATQQDRVEAAARKLLPLVERTQQLGCRLGIYNHGGWAGEPGNMVAVCQYLHKQHNAAHVGIVYNLHHGHGHLDNFAELLEMMQPYLLCVNLNGMARDGEARGQKILPLGEGEFDVALLKTLRDSNYAGPMGIIGHTQDDVELRLQDNLAGLHWILPQLEGQPAGPKPKLSTWTPAANASKPLANIVGTLLAGQAEYRQPPLTVECRATLADARGYNILVASDTKQSGAHWELFTNNGDGTLTAYLPGCKPDHIRSQAKVCDNQAHTFTMIYQPQRVRLLVDGRQVADTPIQSHQRPAVPDKLAIGRLVEGGIGCRGTIDWVRVSRSVREIPAEPVLDVAQDDQTLLLWRSEKPAAAPEPAAADSSRLAPEYSQQLVQSLLQESRAHGDRHRGLLAFANAKSACLSCHRVALQGGAVGPDLTELGKQRKPEEIVEAVLWPARSIRPEYAAHLVIDTAGRSHQGYIVRQDERQLVLRDPQKCDVGDVTLAREEIELLRETGTLMPDNLTATMSEQQLGDLLQFLLTLGTDEAIPNEELAALLTHAYAHAQGPAEFPFDRQPLDPKHWPAWQHQVNRDRIYDFYAKQADYFRAQPAVPPLLAEFPGLDGGALGHWGNQNDTVWADSRWNDTELGSVLCGVFRNGKVTVPRGVCVRLEGHDDLAVCFNPDTLGYDALWSGGFLSFSSQRLGFLAGLRPQGQPLKLPAAAKPADEPFKYHGFYRHGEQVLFSYRLGETEMLDAPVAAAGGFQRVVAPAQEHPLRHLVQDAPARWPQEIETPITLGDEGPYAVDTIGLPDDNPWKAMLFCGGHAFLPDGSALVCTMQGDVWRVRDFEYPSHRAKWRRFASGLHHPQGIVVDDDGVFVLGRDQITRLHDRNGDGEADFYECFSSAYQTSPAGHDFICGLERDEAGRFYTASGNQGLLRISPDGQRAEVIATGFRNPDGLGLLPDGTVTVPCSEGSWTPSSMICAVRPDESSAAAADDSQHPIPHFGYPGPRAKRVPELPMAYLPRGLDNSSGGQAFIASDDWGPLSRQLIHFSFGMGAQFLVLRDEVAGQLQGAVVPLPGEFRSGVHRGRFRPADQQLYVSGMQGWGSYTPDDGCFHRVRYTGGSSQLPIGFHVHENGILLKFSLPLEAATAAVPGSHFAQTWNYRYGPGYGSPEFSTRHAGMRGHDTLEIAAAHLLPDGESLFLQIPDLQPTNQLHLRVQSAAGQFHDLFVTVHQLDAPFDQLPGYQEIEKTIAPHPLLADLAMATRSVPNPHVAKLAKAREITIETGTNLSFQTRLIRVKAGEPVALTLSNPDVVPHNWALIRPGTIDRVGALADRAISDPEAALRHYIPSSTDVLAYTNVVLPREKFTIYFAAPSLPGRYPYLCIFPGHWKVMNGAMIVE